MKKKTMVIIGILGMLLAVGAMSVAMAQNTSSEKTNDPESHQCTPEMMGNMSKNCPQQMMQSGTHENMMNATNESSMMDNKPTGNTETTGADHCGGADSDMGSMMGAGATATKAMV
jgi:hypothetical protein